MRSLQLLLGGLLAASSSLVRAEPQTASIYIQPIRISSPPPTLLAEITFDLSPSSSSDEDAGAASPPPSAAEAELGGSSGGAIKAAVTAFEAPELPDHTTSASSLVRIGARSTPTTRSAQSEIEMATELTAAQLRAYDGTDASKPIYVAIRGKVFDVSAGRGFYGPGGDYALFAGREAARALAKMSKDAADVSGDLSGLSDKELGVLADWESKFQAKYPVVARLAA